MFGGGYFQESQHPDGRKEVLMVVWRVHFKKNYASGLTSLMANFYPSNIRSSLSWMLEIRLTDYLTPKPLVAIHSFRENVSATLSEMCWSFLGSTIQWESRASYRDSSLYPLYSTARWLRSSFCEHRFIFRSTLSSSALAFERVVGLLHN